MSRRLVVTDLLILIAFGVVTVLALLQIPRIEVDGSTEAFLPSNHPIVELNRDIESTFDSMDSMVLALTVSFGTILEPEIITLIREITSTLAANENVDDVISISSIDYVTGTNGEMTVVPLVEGVDPAMIRQAGRRITDWPEAYVGTVVSQDLRTAAIIVQPRSDATPAEVSELYQRMRALAAGNESANLAFRVAGRQVVFEEITNNVAADATLLIPAAAALIILVLWISFRRLLGVLYPVTGILVAGLWIVGLIGAAGITLTMATLLIPVLLLVVGSAYGIHVMQHFYDDVARERGFIPYTRIREIVSSGIGTIWKPVLLAGITTAAGFIAQLSSPIGPFRAFGALSAVGVGAALLTSLVLIPALIRLRYRDGVEAARLHRRAQPDDGGADQPVMSVAERIVRHQRPAVVAVAVILAAATAIAIPRIQVGTNPMNFFPPRSTVATDTRAINEELGGTGIVSVRITGPEPGSVLHPDILRDLEGFERFLLGRYPQVTGVRSIVPSIRRMNAVLNSDSVPYEVVREEPAIDFFSSGGFFLSDSSDETARDAAPAEGSVQTGVADAGFDGNGFESSDRGLTRRELAGIVETAVLNAGVNAGSREILQEILVVANYNGAAFNEVPRNPAKYGLTSTADLQNLVSQYLVLYSGNLGMFINDALEPDRTLVTVQVSDENRDVLLPLRRDIAEYWNHHLPSGWDLAIGGPATLSLTLSELVTRSQYLSLIGALVIVWAIVAVTFRSPVAGFLGIIPVAFALVGVFLSMSVFGFYLDIVTSLLAALAIGIGVDYAIHFMSAYRRAADRGDVNPLRSVYRTTGSAILFNAASVSVGFLALLISQFVPIRQMGILFSVSMAFAGAASLLVLPVALEFFSPRFITRGAPRRNTNSRSTREIDTLSPRPVPVPVSGSGRSGSDGNGDHAEPDGRAERAELGDGHPDDARPARRVGVDPADPDPRA